MTIQSIAFLFVAGACFSYSGFRIFQLILLLKAHKRPEFRLNQIPLRLKAVLVNVLGQSAVLQKKGIGILHTTIFWGFLIITIGTLEQFLSTLVPGANFEFIGRPAYAFLVAVQDVFTLLVFLAVLGAAYRRYIIRPKGLTLSRDATLVLILTGSLMLAIFFMNVFALLSETPWYGSYQFVSSFFAKGFRFFSFQQSTYAFLFVFFKWVHMLLVLFFGMYIPSSKHLHVLAAGPNTFLKHLTREKPMRTLDFDKDQIGAAKITDFSWKDGLDYYSCTECGRCQDVCPAYHTGKPLSPKKLIADLKHNLYANKAAIFSGNADQVSAVLDENVTQDVIWACTSCRACEVACPVFIEHTDKIYDIRRNLVMNESQFPAGVQNVFQNLENNATPWAFSSADRANWAEGLSIPTIQENLQAEILLWAGCAGSFDDRNKKVLHAFVRVLKKAQVNFAILGNEEQCTGDPARRIGNEYLFQMLAKNNVETLNRYQVKTIVTACPHCFNTLKNEYPDFGGHYEVIHHAQFIAKLIAEGKIQPAKTLTQKVTFHDSCYLGRWNGIYDAPRDVLGAVAQISPVEMKSSKEKSLCCGAGGGRMFMEETLGSRINVARIEQAIETESSVVASSCPFCLTMMTDGIKSKEMGSQMKAMDIAELTDAALS
jgi:Fe-S oxidoreductase